MFPFINLQKVPCQTGMFAKKRGQMKEGAGREYKENYKIHIYQIYTHCDRLCGILYRYTHVNKNVVGNTFMYILD